MNTVELQPKLLQAEALLDATLQHVKTQSIEPDNSNVGGHPDASIRAFYRGLLNYLDTGEKDISALQFKAHLLNVAFKRTHLDATHYTDLLARAAQFTLRRAGNSEYVQYSQEDWKKYFSEMSNESFQEFVTQLETRSVASHVPVRYRGVGALSALLCKQKGRPINIADFGCSLNLGLPSILSQTYLLKNGNNGNGGENDYAFHDSTPGQVVINLLLQDQIQYGYAVGIDRQDLQTVEGEEWVRACAYFGQYDANAEKLQKNTERLTPHINSIETAVADVTVSLQENEKLRNLMQGNEQSFDIIHSSMMMYQLPPEKQRQVLDNATQMLEEGGLFVELTFDDPSDWFKPKNIISTVRIKQNGELSAPFVWLRWDNSRCANVEVGDNFEQVNTLLCITDSPDAKKL